MSRIYKMSFASVYPHYVNKIERKGRTSDELHKVIFWLTGYTKPEINKIIKSEMNFEDFFSRAKLNPNAHLITGAICGVKIENIDDQLMKQVRYLDKLVDELAKGRPLEKTLRSN